MKALHGYIKFKTPQHCVNICVIYSISTVFKILLRQEASIVKLIHIYLAKWIDLPLNSISILNHLMVLMECLVSNVSTA